MVLHAPSSWRASIRQADTDRCGHGRAKNAQVRTLACLVTRSQSSTSQAFKPEGMSTFSWGFVRNPSSCNETILKRNKLSHYQNNKSFVANMWAYILAKRWQLGESCE